MTRDELSGSMPDAMEALERMLAALRILDGIGAPGDIGSHLDLAIARLQERLGLPRRPDPFGQLSPDGLEPDLARSDAALADAPHRDLFPPL